MPVAFVSWRQFHKISIDGLAETNRICRTFENLTLKLYILVRKQHLSWELFVEPRAVRVHTVIALAEKMAHDTEARKN